MLFDKNYKIIDANYQFFHHTKMMFSPNVDLT